MADQEEQKPSGEEEQQTVGAAAEESAATTEDQPAEPAPGEGEQPPQAEESAEQPTESSAAEGEAEQPQPEEPTEGGGGEEQPEAEGQEEAAEGKKEGEEGEAAAPEEAAEAEKVEEKEEEEEEEPVVVTPEGNPHWLSTDDVVARGVPEDEVENYKNFHFKKAYSLQSCYEDLKDHTCQTEFISLTSEEVDVLLVASHPGQAEGSELSDEQKQVLSQLEERIGQAVSLYDEDGASIKVNFRSPKDAVLERNEPTFVTEIRDAVINGLEVEKQSANAYQIWSERDERAGVIRRGIRSIRRSFRRSRTESTSRPKPQLEEEKKEEEGEKKEGEEEGEKAEGEKKEGEEEGEKGEEGEGEKKAEEGEGDKKEGGEDEGEKKEEGGEEPAAAEAPAAEEPAGETVTVTVAVEHGEGGEAEEQPAPEQAEATQPEEPPPQQEGGGEEGGEKKEGEGEAAKEGEGEEAEPAAAAAGEGEIEEVGKEEGEKEGEGQKEEEEEKHVPKSARKKAKVSAEHTHRKVKAEPLDNQILRAFGKAIRAKYRVANGSEALEQLLRSFTFKQELTQVKAFGAVEDARVTLSIRRWDAHMPRYPGMEFRGFVFNNELHALSQLDDTTYYPNVDHYKTTIYHKVDEFFREHVKETLNEKESYIIDFFVAPDKVYVIDLSPFYTSIGACLFTWTEHAKILVKGPFEFRIVETPMTAPEAFSSFQADWKSMLEAVLEQRRNERRQQRGCVLL